MLVRECPGSLKYCLIQRRQASRQAQYIPKIYESWEQILGSQNFLSWCWIWIIQFGSQKGVNFHLQCIFLRWKYAGRYFPGTVNACTVQSKCTPRVQIWEVQRDPNVITRWLWVSQEEMFVFFCFINILFFLICLLVCGSLQYTQIQIMKSLHTGQAVIYDLSQAGKMTGTERNSVTCSSCL